MFQSAKTIQIGDTTRHYRLYAPKNPDKILLALHEFGGSSRTIAYYSGLQNEADANNMVVVFPEALPSSNPTLRRGWNAGFCCGSGWKNNTDDVRFISELVDTLKNQYAADEVYIVGFSSGAMMSLRLAAEKPGLATAYAAVAGTIGSDESRNVPTGKARVGLFHGKQDKTVPIGGGGRTSVSMLPQTETIDAFENAGATVGVKNYPNLGHRWFDWRLFNPAKHRPEGTRDILSYLFKK